MRNVVVFQRRRQTNAQWLLSWIATELHYCIGLQDVAALILYRILLNNAIAAQINLSGVKSLSWDGHLFTGKTNECLTYFSFSA